MFDNDDEVFEHLTVYQVMNDDGMVMHLDELDFKPETHLRIRWDRVGGYVLGTFLGYVLARALAFGVTGSIAMIFLMWIEYLAFVRFAS